MRRIGVAKNGWNTYACILGPFWYFSRGIVGKGIVMMTIVLATFGVYLIPVMVYCGIRGNSDLYKHIKERGRYIY